MGNIISTVGLAIAMIWGLIFFADAVYNGLSIFVVILSLSGVTLGILLSKNKHRAFIGLLLFALSLPPILLFGLIAPTFYESLDTLDSEKVERVKFVVVLIINLIMALPGVAGLTSIFIPDKQKEALEL